MSAAISIKVGASLVVAKEGQQEWSIEQARQRGGSTGMLATLICQ
jgi:hypothetical protein